MFSPVIPRDKSLIKNSAVSPTSSCVVVRRKGARSSIAFNEALKSLIPFAESVRIGPAEIELTRIPFFP